MKRKLLRSAMILVLAMLSIKGVTQETQAVRTIPKWISEKGYWQVESNIKTPENFIVYFFNNEGTMVYKERVEGVKLNIKKRRTLMRLKKLLDQAVIAWEDHPVMKENEMLVATALKGSWVVR